MDNRTNGKDGDGNTPGDILRERELERLREQIFQRWLEREPPDRIAERMHIHVAIVYEQLKRAQKERVVEQGG